ncbi:MAG: 2TM domain-containing protein [Actinomycetia bacterium]|nr:2TM domain-containing protein [Actinomycetes bacterium]
MDEKEKYIKAKKRVEEIKGFYAHLITYISVIIVLMVINLVTSPGFLWFLIVAGAWGFGLFWHAMGVFVFTKSFGASWEQRKIKEIMDKEKNNE